MQSSNRTTLVFLGSCLLFAEGALGLIAGMTDANPDLVAGFALAALVSVLSTLAFMYWRDPAFLTLSSKEALDLGRFDRLMALVREYPSLGAIVLNDVDFGDLDLKKSTKVGEAEEVGDDEFEDIERNQRAILDRALDRSEQGG